MTVNNGVLTFDVKGEAAAQYFSIFNTLGKSEIHYQSKTGNLMITASPTEFQLQLHE